MTPYYLKFSDEAQAQSVLYTPVMTTDEEGNEVETGEYTPNFKNISVIGLLYNDDAVLDAEGNVVTPATAKDGWHVNVLVVDEGATAIKPFSVAVATPNRVWGGI